MWTSLTHWPRLSSTAPVTHLSPSLMTKPPSVSHSSFLYLYLSTLPFLPGSHDILERSAFLSSRPRLGAPWRLGWTLPDFAPLVPTTHLSPTLGLGACSLKDGMTPACWSTKSSEEVVSVTVGGLAQARGSSRGSGDPGWSVAGPTCAKTVLGARDKVGLTIWECVVVQGRFSGKGGHNLVWGTGQGTLPGEGILWKVWQPVQRHGGLKRKLLQAGRREVSNTEVV